MKLQLPRALQGLATTRNVQESCGFEWFLSRTSKKIPGVFEPMFWTILAPQAAEFAPAVFHAAVALGAAHRRDMLISTNFASFVPDEDEYFILEQYNRAISYLKPHLRAGAVDPSSAYLVAIVCVLFICLEFLRGNYRTGNVHLQNGVYLLRMLQVSSDAESRALVPSLYHVSPFDDIAEAFTRLYVQSTFFGALSEPLSEAVYRDHSDTNISIFLTIEAARTHLDRLLERAFRLTEQFREMPPLVDPVSILPLLCNQQDIRGRLETWLRVYRISRDRMAMKSDDNTQIQLARRLLLVYHTVAYVMTESCVAPTDELVFDRFSSEFASIVNRCMDLWKIATAMISDRTLNGHFAHESGFSADMGIILPLYYTCLKCRVSETRHRALALLLSSGAHQEGIWNSRSAARVAQRVIEIEEGDYYFDSRINQSLPESNRVYDVDMKISDCSMANIILSYRMKQDKSARIVREEVLSLDSKVGDSNL